MLRYDNPPTLIPFVVGPGDQLYMAVDVKLGWLARGAKFVDIEMQQEGRRMVGQSIASFNIVQIPRILLGSSLRLRRHQFLGEAVANVRCPHATVHAAGRSWARASKSSLVLQSR